MTDSPDSPDSPQSEIVSIRLVKLFPPTLSDICFVFYFICNIIELISVNPSSFRLQLLSAESWSRSSRLIKISYCTSIRRKVNERYLHFLFKGVRISIFCDDGLSDQLVESGKISGVKRTKWSLISNQSRVA